MFPLRPDTRGLAGNGLCAGKAHPKMHLFTSYKGLQFVLDNAITQLLFLFLLHRVLETVLKFARLQVYTGSLFAQGKMPACLQECLFSVFNREIHQLVPKSVLPNS